MRSVDRVLACLELEEPDRVPIGEIGYDLIVISRALGLNYTRTYSGENVRMRNIGRDARVLSSFIEKMNLDIVPVAPSSPSGGDRTRMIDNETQVDEWGAKYRYRDGIKWYVGPALKEADDIERLEPPSPYAPGLMDGPKLLTRKFKGERALAGSIPGPKIPYLARGIDGYNIDLFTRPSLARKLMDMVTEYNIELGKRLIEEGVDLIVMSGDVACNGGPIVSVRHFKEVFVPAIREPARVFHKLRIPMVKHTDGYLDPILDDLVKTEIDGLHSIEPMAGMNIEKVKNNHGDKLCLWGNIDLSHTLSIGTTEDVIKEVKERIKIAAPGGGYILSSSNSYSSAMKFSNFSAMVRAGRRYGRYL